MATERYGTQRQKLTPPHISLRSLRESRGLTLQQVCDLADQHLDGPRPFTKGALSAIETGLRGPSAHTLRALEHAYGLKRGAITTNYEPRNRDLRESA
jgi:transcriptional regulator with XRE-family HTH domain